MLSIPHYSRLASREEKEKRETGVARGLGSDGCLEAEERLRTNPSCKVLLNIL